MLQIIKALYCDLFWWSHNLSFLNENIQTSSCVIVYQTVDERSPLIIDSSKSIDVDGEPSQPPEPYVDQEPNMSEPYTDIDQGEPYIIVQARKVRIYSLNTIGNFSGKLGRTALNIIVPPSLSALTFSFISFIISFCSRFRKVLRL